jgi:hypothetical protein
MCVCVCACVCCNIEMCARQTDRLAAAILPYLSLSYDISVVPVYSIMKEMPPAMHRFHCDSRYMFRLYKERPSSGCLYKNSKNEHYKDAFYIITYNHPLLTTKV